MGRLGSGSGSPCRVRKVGSPAGVIGHHSAPTHQGGQGEDFPFLCNLFLVLLEEKSHVAQVNAWLENAKIVSAIFFQDFFALQCG